MKLFFSLIFLFLFYSIYSQEATIRGNVYDSKTGEPIIYGTVYIDGTNKAVNTNENGFFTFKEIEVGNYKIVATYLGYDSISANVSISKKNEIKYVRLEMQPSGLQLEEVNVSAERDVAKREVQISMQTVKASDIQALPSIGGVADLAQYLPVLPGVVFTGDQGGQLYIRGGSPVQNLILLDGMPIYNAFHSIGLFSVFETEIISNVDVFSAGFSAEYGGRVSAVIDINTRAGNNKRFSGMLGLNPFQANFLFEGPIKKSTPESPSSFTFLVAGKRGLISETDDLLYSYASDSSGLPFDYQDIYAKMTYSSGNGSRFDFFGFNFTDDVVYPGIADLNWTASGGGTKFTVIPNSSQTIVKGSITGSGYDIGLAEQEGVPRMSSINTFNANIELSNYGKGSVFKYGLGINTISTDFQFTNFADIPFQQKDNNTELTGFLLYKKELAGLILEPSVRSMYYASINEITLEPRLRIKYNISDDLRFKAATGYYTQNLLSTVNDRDIVNLFVGFLLAPQERLQDPFTGEDLDTRIQGAWHYVAGFEYDLGNYWNFNLEGYYKDYKRVININRNKVDAQDPNYIVEEGEAYGIDLNAEYKYKNWDVWMTYSYAFVNRNDGNQIYPTNFDRRHNSNVLVTYKFGKESSWEASARWNFGTGFPFTLTRGFYGQFDFEDGVEEDIVQGNPELGILFDDDINGGRLPTYHRLDLSLKKRFIFSEYSNLEVSATITNAYDRENIFFFDRVEYDRVNQLPILPSLGVVFRF